MRVPLEAALSIPSICLVVKQERVPSWAEALPAAPPPAERAPQQLSPGLMLSGSARGVTGIAACLDDAAKAVGHVLDALGADASGAAVGSVSGRTTA